MPLQRAIVDFAADESFGRAVKKLKEHYSIDIPESTIRKITYLHAYKMKALKKEIQTFDLNRLIVEYIIAQADGAMVPIVVVDKDAEDRRKNKTLIYREARLTLAYPKGEIQPIFDASFGSTHETGDQLAYCVKLAGQKEHTKILCVGDGALWIAEQVERIFGDDAVYLIDFYHLSQYLAEAEKCGFSTDGSWRRDMQALMKESKITTVLNELKAHMNDPDKNCSECGAEKCYNYMIKRLNQFDYKGALEQGLPIGSGRVESGHKNIMQSRLKLSGAWWLEENADAMLSLRVVRENGAWENYWSNFAYQPISASC